MKIAGFKLYSYELPLKKQLNLKGVSIDARVGLILKIFDSGGNSGYGEIAPLPGFSRETLHEAKIQTIQVCNSLKNALSPQKPEELGSALKVFPGRVYPSVSFGVSSALLLLSADGGNINLCQLFNKDCRRSLLVNALLSGSTEEVMADLPLLKKKNYRSVKLKVGQKDLQQDIALTKAVRSQLGDSIDLRLDANRSWTGEQAAVFYEGAKDCRIEYIEEPVSNRSELLRLLNQKELEIPVALDETLTEIEPPDIHKYKAAKAVVIKPTLLGLEKAISLAGLAKAENMTSVFSSAYESVLGLSIIAQLAAGICPDTPCGLDTSGIFADDIYVNLLPVENGRIEMDNTTLFDKQFKSLSLTELNTDE